MNNDTFEKYESERTQRNVDQPRRWKPGGDQLQWRHCSIDRQTFSVCFRATPGGALTESAKLQAPKEKRGEREIGRCNGGQSHATPRHRYSGGGGGGTSHDSIIVDRKGWKLAGVVFG